MRRCWKLDYLSVLRPALAQPLVSLQDANECPFAPLLHKTMASEGDTEPRMEPLSRGNSLPGQFLSPMHSLEDRAVEALCSLHTVLAAQAAGRKAPTEASTESLEARDTDQTQSQQHPQHFTGEAFSPQPPSSPPSSEPSPSRPQQRPCMPGSTAGRQARPQQAQQGASAGGEGEEDSGPGGRRWPGVSVSHKRTWNNDKTTWRAVVLLDRKNHQVAVHGLASQEEAGCARDLLFAWREAYFGGRPSDAAPICIFPFSLYGPHLGELVKCRTEAAIKAYIKSLRDGGMLRQLASTATPRESPLHPWPAPAPLRIAEELDALLQPPPAPKPASMAFQVTSPVAQGPPAPLSPAPKKPRHPARASGKAAAGRAGQPAGSPPPSAFLQPLALPAPLPGPLPPVTTWGSGSIPGLSTPAPEQPAPATAGSGGSQEGSPLSLTTQRSSSGTIVVVTAASASDPILKLASLLEGYPHHHHQQQRQAQYLPTGVAGRDAGPSSASPSPMLITSNPFVGPAVVAGADTASAAKIVKAESPAAPAALPTAVASSPLPAVAEQVAPRRPRFSPAGGAAKQVPEVAQLLAAIAQASGPKSPRPAASPGVGPWAESLPQPGYGASQAEQHHNYQQVAHTPASARTGGGFVTQGKPPQQPQAGGYPRGAVSTTVVVAAAAPPSPPPPSFPAPAVQQHLLYGLLAQQAVHAQHAQRQQKQQQQQLHAPVRDPRLPGPGYDTGSSPGRPLLSHIPSEGAQHNAGNLAQGTAPTSAAASASAHTLSSTAVAAAAAGSAGVQQGLAGGMESGRALLGLWSMLSACGVAEREIATFCTTWVCGFSGERKAAWYQGIKESYRQGDAAMARLWVRAALSR